MDGRAVSRVEYLPTYILYMWLVMDMFVRDWEYLLVKTWQAW